MKDSNESESLKKNDVLVWGLFIGVVVAFGFLVSMVISRSSVVDTTTHSASVLNGIPKKVDIIMVPIDEGMVDTAIK